MMLTLSVFYSIPEFDISTLFLLSCGSGVNGNLGNGGNLPTIRASGASSVGDPERIHLQTSGGNRYSQQINDSESLGGSGVSFISNKNSSELHHHFKCWLIPEICIKLF